MTYSIDRSSVADRWDAISYEAQLLLLDKHNLLGGCVVSRDITKHFDFDFLLDGLVFAGLFCFIGLDVRQGPKEQGD